MLRIKIGPILVIHPFYSHPTDTKIAEQLLGSSMIKSIKKDIGWNPLRVQHLHAERKFWSHRISSAIGLKVGMGIKRMNDQYGPYFNAQHFLWPTPEQDRLIVRSLGTDALKDLDDYRRQMMKDLFVNEDIAARVIRRAYSPNFRIATRIRSHFDVEYALGDLDQNSLDDYRAYGIGETGQKRLLYIKTQKEKIDKEFLDDVNRNHPFLLKDKEGLRVARILYGLGLDMEENDDISGFEKAKMYFEEWVDNFRDVYDAVKKKDPTSKKGYWHRTRRSVDSVIQASMKYKQRVSQSLEATRRIHTLSIMEFDEYREEVIGLMRYRSPLLQAN